MAREIYFAAPGWAGMRHRFMTLNHVRSFTAHTGYQPHLLWGVSSGVGYRRFEELLAPIPGFKVTNVPEAELDALEKQYRTAKAVTFRGQTLSTYRRGSQLKDKMVAYDLGSDLAASNGLQDLVPADKRPTVQLGAVPSAGIRAAAAARIEQHGLRRRLGIRVRVTECPEDGRKPRRMRGDLEATVRAIIRLPWHVRTFIATDSEYIQQMLASHFRDIRYLPKRFSQVCNGSRYIDRVDPDAMRTFMIEVRCLAACPKILNIGGVVNEEGLSSRMLYPPLQHSEIGSLGATLGGAVQHGRHA